LAEPLRRIAVTGGRSPLGQRIVDALRRDPRVEHVRGVEARPGRSAAEDADLEIVPLLPDHRPFAEYLEKERIDTVIQSALVADRSGISPSATAANVIETMCLGAAIAHERVRVKNWILASSTAVYPIDVQAPRFQHEQSELRPGEATLAASIAEAEDYARDVAERLPHANVAILRLQHLAGREARGSLAALLARRIVPSPIGFDPLVQLLHLDDAAEAVAFATRAELAGIYNVASAGVIHWGEAVRATGRTAAPVLPVSAGLLEPVIARLGVPLIPAELVALMCYGHAVDTQKLERTGWKPRHDQEDILSEFGRS